MSDAVPKFLEAMAAAGMDPEKIDLNRLAAGELVRFPCKGDRRPNAWAVLHSDGRPAGAFGHNARGIRFTWCDDASPPIDPAELRAKRKEWAEAKKRRAIELASRHSAARAAAIALWRAAAPSDPGHAYLARKRMTGEFIRQRGNLLLVPMHDLDGDLWNLQRIAPDGTKLFLKGGRVDGLMHLVGKIGPTLAIGEGVSTMAAVRRATGYPVAAAFSANNLLTVARVLRERLPAVDMIICGDDDAHLLDNPHVRRNVGMEAAYAAAQAVGARVATPRRRG